MSKKDKIWLTKPNADDLKAARLYLELISSPSVASHLIRSFQKATTVDREAKDLLRAAELHLLEKSSPHVAADLKRIEKDKKLSPVLIVRGDFLAERPLLIADGYHRICASWYWDENLPVACRIVAAPGRG